jgi:hypothetical protein
MPKATSTEYCWFAPFLLPLLPSPFPPLLELLLLPEPWKFQNSSRLTETRCGHSR